MIAKEDRNNWTKDNKGLTINDKIITPILSDVYKLMIKYQNEILGYASEDEFDIEEARISGDIIENIKDFTLHKAIHKAIAPYFKTIPDIEPIEELY